MEDEDEYIDLTKNTWYAYIIMLMNNLGFKFTLIADYLVQIECKTFFNFMSNELAPIKFIITLSNHKHVHLSQKSNV